MRPRHAGLSRRDLRTIRSKPARIPVPDADRPRSSSTISISHQPVRVAVGISVARYPPHRSPRAALPHEALILDEWRQSELGVRMQDARNWDPPFLQSTHSRPVQIAPLAATNQNLPPKPGHPIAEYAKDIGVTWYRVIVEVALHDRFEASPAHTPVYASTAHLVTRCAKLGAEWFATPFS